MIRVLLVDDHDSFRQALAFMLEQEPDCTVTAEVGTLAAAIMHLGECDVAVLDLDLPDGDGTTLIAMARERDLPVAPLVLTGNRERQRYALAVEAGALGVLHKSVRIREVIAAIRRLGAGEMLFSAAEIVELRRLARQPHAEARDAARRKQQLTRRERDVLQALAEGLNDREIAARLGVSPETARTHMGNLLAKFGVESRLQVLIYALRHGLVALR